MHKMSEKKLIIILHVHTLLSLPRYS